MFLVGTVTFFFRPSSGGLVSYTMDIGCFLPGGKMAKREALQVGFLCFAEVKRNVLCSVSLICFVC
jgi:hypothetical protein